MTAPDHLLRKYLRGGCFALAHEAHRLSGLPVIALRDAAGDPHHAFVAEEGIGWDIRGRLPLAAVAQGCAVPDPQISPLPLEELRAIAGDDPYAHDAAARAVRAHLLPAGLPVRSELRAPLPYAGTTIEPPAAKAEFYTWGACHLFAIAALDLLAYDAAPLGFRVVTDPEEPFWTSETDPDDEVPAVVHVYAVLRGPQGEVAVDVYGVRPLAEAVAECAERFGTRAPDFEDYPDLDALRDLIEQEDDPDGADRCPLWPISMAEIEEARKAARLLLAHAAPESLGPRTEPEGPSF